jgi:hypothetical protein
MEETTIMSQTNETLDEEKKRIKREKHREYMRKRRSEDPDFNEKQKELNRNRKKYLYHNDEQFRDRQQKYSKEYSKNKSRENKNYKQLYEELLKSKNIGG